MVSALIDIGSDINGTERDDQFSLSIAYFKQDMGMIDLLTAKEARVDFKHTVQSATTGQESLRRAVDVVGLLNGDLFRKKFPSRIVEEE